MTRISIKHFEEIIGAICLAAMVTIDFVNVLTRYVFKVSMAFSEELTLYLFVWVTMMGASIAFREGSNMAVSFFYDHFNGKWKKIMTVLSSILSLIFFAVLLYFGVHEVIDEIELNVTTEAIELPVWWFTGAVPVCSVCIIYRIISWTRFLLRKPSKGREEAS
ncbi:MAG: TRAP transporter small permease [Pyramidobacter sp.]|uniref:TRAP transporter small permease n=1 Tax=Pyramidobacter sp. TaxID=1943581 RepID=UPI002A7F1B8B|nr:TRAP transporter small permease [Pyramidobacter sp.]MDY4031437.1 TRAP transporter small permease [Pyramidobacter sp.]MDY4172364.1 TRAP transporter small permease [Evtepia sp.]